MSRSQGFARTWRRREFVLKAVKQAAKQSRALHGGKVSLPYIVSLYRPPDAYTNHEVLTDESNEGFDDAVDGVWREHRSSDERCCKDGQDGQRPNPRHLRHGVNPCGGW